MDRIPELGCLACRLQGLGKVYAEVHHLTIGGKHGAPRRGHAFTIGLCLWHHRGRVFEGWSFARCRQEAGPSYAERPRLFRETYGDDDRLLELQAERLAA